MNILKVLTEKRIKGNIGEAGVCKLLKKRKYKILERNYVADGHEIDIIAENKEYICFIEVKARSENAKNTYNTRPSDAVDAKKRSSIISAARVYASVCGSSRKKFRFDVAEVYLDEEKNIKEINYLEGAFTADHDKRIRFKST